ncbi:hypothetical protein QTO01_12440 [Vibrio mytili]|uniref:Membrane protein n=1 Tax=Vibrio mytili TaxID=50718 RepID=A0A0C3HUJ7_9VIBR|nr:hypothetical protein [Vibrio mytili]KIN11901.1 membrane protein [Vibrio mytili]
MLTILLVGLALYIFWLLFNNTPVLAEGYPQSIRPSIGPTQDHEEWRDYYVTVFKPFSSQTTFYAIAYFAHFVAAANGISWATVYEGDYPLIISRYGSYFILNTYDTLLASGFIALALFIINWQIAIHCTEFISQYLVRFVIITRVRFVAMSLVLCSYLSYLLTISIFWLFQESYSFWYGLTVSPLFLLIALLVMAVLPSASKSKVKKNQ